MLFKKGRKYINIEKNLVEKNKENKIKLKLDTSKILETYSPKEEYILNEELSQYLIKKTRPIKNDVDLEINAFVDSKSDGEVFSIALKNTFKEKIIEIKHDIRAKNILAFFMTLIGISILGLGYILQELTSLIIFEIFLVASWVFIWRAVELLFFERARLKYKKKKCMDIYLSKINCIMSSEQSIHTD